MKTFIPKIMLIATILSLFGCKGKNDPSTWSESKLNEWYGKNEWKNGWAPVADESINKKELAVSYFRHKERWDSAFNFLKNNDLTQLENKKHVLDGDNLFVNVSEYNTKNPEEGKLEEHRKYIDIQYVAKGSELIGIIPLTAIDSIVVPYDETKDVEFSKSANLKMHTAIPDNFFIFFPGDSHMPSLKIDTVAPVKKIVVKLKID